ncbi:MAG: hypothetical protein CMJ81_12955 [Planctomycetaceae bacterium]|nr:hypothetical protein [Planctomycetaceae bacterium]
MVSEAVAGERFVVHSARGSLVVRTLIVAFIAMVVLPISARAQDGPLTVPERSGWKETSRQAEVAAFLERLDGLPHGDRLARRVIGRTSLGKELLLVSARLEGEGAPSKLRILINANIHAGEVEGKEAVQILLREIAGGAHTEILRRADLFFVPDYNADGNDEISTRHRVSQYGPVGGVGLRPNAMRLDLNRDFVKVASPEARALFRVFREHDPHVFMDLHTTNGSAHGYHLTYAPSLSTNIDPSLDTFMREDFLPAVRMNCGAVDEGYRLYHYGNFDRRDPPSRWSTYDHRPRFGTNYYGLRNRIGILSEAYSYKPFEVRVRATRAFVLECLRMAAKEADRIQELCRSADERLVRATGEPVAFGYDTDFAPAFEDDLLSCKLERVPHPDGVGNMMRAGEKVESVRVSVRVAFASKQHLLLPKAWIIPSGQRAVIQALLTHGVEVGRLKEVVEVDAEVFVVRRVSRGRRYQNRNPVVIEGDVERRSLMLKPGMLVVSASQRLARVAAQLLEARSEDSLATWNLVAGELRSLVGEAEFDYPVFRSISSRRLPVESITLEAMSAGRPQVIRILGGTPIQWQIDGRNIGSEDLLTQELETLIEELGAVPIKVIVSPGATYEQVSTTVDLISRSGFLEIRPSRGR